MNLFTISMVCIFIFTAFGGIINIFKGNTQDTRKIYIRKISAVTTIIFELLFLNVIVHTQLGSNVQQFLSDKYVIYGPGKMHLIIIAIIILIHICLNVIINFIIRILDNVIIMISRQNKNIDIFSNLIIRITYAIACIIKGFINVAIITYVIYLITASNLIKIKFEDQIKDSKMYNYIVNEHIIPFNENIIPTFFERNYVEGVFNQVINNYSKNNVIIYYNGVTLKDGIQSNDEIDKKAKEITLNKSDEKEKAFAIYKWIEKEFKYDEDKASKILSGEYSQKSGAIALFEEKQGICFDYACLYVSMCRAVGLKVRLITGLGYDGKHWVNHAWNEVYIQQEGTWINVDTTYSTSGNYFNNDKFNIDHKESSIAGEW